MKRLILFRGKRVDDGQWIYGDLLTSNGTCCEISDWNEVDYSRHDVGKETVCQCIVISDKHGIEIFEDDIVKYFEPNSKTWYTRIAKWDWRFAGFGLFDKESEWCKESDWVKIKDIEVIGNIHDNKELLP